MDRTHDSSLLDRQLPQRLNNPLDATDIVRHVEFSLAAGQVHVSDLAEHGALCPALVMHASDRPRTANVAVRVSPIELILVIQVDCDAQRLAWRRGPLQDLLGPVHAQKSVHLARVNHLQLRRVPQLVVSPAFLQLLGCVNHLSLVSGVLAQRLLRPRVVVVLRVQPVQSVIPVWVEEAVVLSQLTPHNALFDERGDSARVRLPGDALDLQSGALCRELPEVKPGRQVR
mmetsp:Transcript_11833/g.37852  ORF Transcript_11833/g.37852 Transcript_11833/m.37852 type:complete len:229 (+) Transcript_11833:25-711(+)